MNVSLQLTIGMGAAHRNQYLFSDHYLNNLLPDDDRWSAALPETETFLAWLQDLYAREKDQLPEYNEDQLEEHWFKPILAQLGHTFERQASVPGLEAGVKRPDYVFFPDQATRQAAVSAQRTEDYTAEALAVGEVKRWDTALSKKQRGGGASFEAQNPSWQIDYYVRATGLDWGILSNGRLWRLVHRDSSQRLSIYYEVDLVDLLSRGEGRVHSRSGAMRYFTLFFRQAAFRPDAQGRIFLDDALAASNAYAVALEEDLEQNVYQALEHLMQGFLDLSANQLGPDDLRAIYDNSLYLLYRLLFILYGESRGLLPLQNDQYRTNYSLTRLKEEIVELALLPLPMSTVYWGWLKNLFRIINGDNAELNRCLNMPRYNGRLFDPQQHPFLEEKIVGDGALVQAIDLLSRRETEAGLEFADYRTLGVRHLGSIYEGLLEYQPRYASEPMVAIRDGKGERWVRAEDAPDDANVIARRDAGQVYLETDRGERKATGSYYTPQYIVEYIVENTVGPLVDEATERVSERRPSVGANRRGDGLVDEILSLKVLDPAMGSGHFLVEATEFLARALATDPYVETEALQEEDLTYWKRRVVERCIYGVDKNPLAVELAKLSLWLATVAAERPLSFLDHHLKCGDSLIGARVEDLGWAPPVILSKKAQRQLEAKKAGQINMFEHRLSELLPRVVVGILEITEVESKDYDTVRAKEAADQAVRKLKEPFLAVANLWTSAHFGHEFNQGDYDESLGSISQPNALMELPAVQRARDMADQRHFFHWELAFPEVFYDQHGQRLGDRAGFDAVIANPPYEGFKIWGSDTLFLDYVKDRYEVYDWHADIFYYFVESGVRLLRERSGRLGYIVSRYFRRSSSGERLRKLISPGVRVFIDFADIQIFDDPSIHSAIILYAKNSNEGKFYEATYTSRQIGEVADSSPREVISEWLAAKQGFALSDESAFRGLEPIELVKGSVPLGDLATVRAGMQSGRDKILVGQIVSGMSGFEGRLPDGSSLPLERDVIHVFVKNGDIERYAHTPMRYCLYIPDGLCEKEVQRRFPGAYAFLQAYKSDLMTRRSSFKEIGEDNWWEWMNSTDVHFRTEKLIVPYRAAANRFSLDQQQMLGSIDVTVLALKDTTNLSLAYILSLLNSSLCESVYQSYAKELSRGIYDYYPTNLSKVPIRRIEFTTPADERAQLVEEAKDRAEEAVGALASSGALGSDTPMDRAMLSQAASPTLGFVAARLAAEPEQADVVHDLLAHLAEQMIAMHKEKQSRVEAFWLDLEGVTDAETFETLRTKGKWERTLWQRSKACRPFVDEESRSTRSLDESLGWNEEAFKVFVKALASRVQRLSDLVGVYRAHSPAYRELVARIQATDWLIDHIVYHLYGLTEEEVALIEKQ